MNSICEYFRFKLPIVAGILELFLFSLFRSFEEVVAESTH